MNPKISVIVPVYKAEKYLHRCVDSILAQTFTDFEVLLIDDGSPDRSGEICDEYAVKDSRVRVFHKENGGVSSARNMGLEYVKGKYIWFIDSDDWIDRNAIGNLLSQQGIGNADICFFGLTPYPNGVPPFSFESILNNQLQIIFSETKACGEIIAKIEQCCGFGWTCNKIFKTVIIQEHNLRFDQRFSIQEDHLFTFAYMMYVKSIAVVSACPYNYYLQDGTLLSKTYSYQNNKERNKAMYESRLAICEQFKISDENYILWFKSDYANRMVSNLRLLKIQDFTLGECLNEVKEVNLFLSRNYVHLSGIRKFYQCIKWLPLRLLLKLLNY